MLSKKSMKPVCYQSLLLRYQNADARFSTAIHHLLISSSPWALQTSLSENHVQPFEISEHLQEEKKVWSHEYSFEHNSIKMHKAIWKQSSREVKKSKLKTQRNPFESEHNFPPQVDLFSVCKSLRSLGVQKLFHDRKGKFTYEITFQSSQ